MLKRRLPVRRAGDRIRVILISGFLTVANSLAVPASFAAEQKYPDMRTYEEHANRELTDEEISKLFELSNRLINKNNGSSDRWFIAEKLGKWSVGHKNAIPALLAVLRDETEDQRLRYKSLTSISRITDKTSIDILIETMTDEDPFIGARAWEQFWKITAQGKRFEIGSNTDLNVRKERANISAKWWAENREDGTIYWERAFMEF